MNSEAFSRVISGKGYREWLWLGQERGRCLQALNPWGLPAEVCPCVHRSEHLFQEHRKSTDMENLRGRASSQRVPASWGGGVRAECWRHKHKQYSDPPRKSPRLCGETKASPSPQRHQQRQRPGALGARGCDYRTITLSGKVVEGGTGVPWQSRDRRGFRAEIGVAVAAAGGGAVLEGLLYQMGTLGLRPPG